MVGQNFGRANCYFVFMAKPGRMATSEHCKKPFHYHGASNASYEHAHGHTNPTLACQHHIGMRAVTQDCEALISAGMGGGACLSYEHPSIKPIVTKNLAISMFVNTCPDGSLQNQLNKLY
jgi:hypothetical protein